jgi:hypothetical protein
MKKKRAVGKWARVWLEPPEEPIRLSSLVICPKKVLGERFVVPF